MKNQIKKLLLCAAISLNFTGLSHAVGASGLQLLSLRASSRGESLGGALTASGDDLSSLAINPATLSRMRYSEAMFTQGLLFEDIKFSYLSYGQPTRFGTPAFEYMNLSYGDFESINREGVRIGNQSPRETLFGFGWSTRRYKTSNSGEISDDRTGFFKDFDAGVNFRYFKSDLGGGTANGISVNLGGLYRTPMPGLFLGLAVNNLGSPVKYQSESQSQPRTLRAGLAYSTNDFMALSSRARFSIDGVLPKDGSIHPGLGAEVFFTQYVSLQAGYAGEENLDKRFRFGAGFGLEAVNFNYSAAPLGDLGTAHRITARMRFGMGIWNIMSILSGEQALKENIKMANEHKGKGDSQRAAVYARRVLKKDPGNEQAKGIIREIEKAERAKMGSQLYSEVVALIRLGLFKEAEEKIKECLELDPENKNYQSIHENISTQIVKSKQTETDKLLAKIRVDQVEPSAAPAAKPVSHAPAPRRTSMEPKTTPQPLDPSSQAEFDRANALIEDRKLDEAIGALRALVEKTRNNEEVELRLSYCLKGRGVRLFTKGKYEESHADFQEASALNPKDPSLKKFIVNVKQIMDSLNLKPTIASFMKERK